MMKDQFANYVVQKILEISNDKHREILLHRIRLHLIALKKYTYGKHIAARFEQLCAEGIDSVSSFTVSGFFRVLSHISTCRAQIYRKFLQLWYYY